MHKIYIVEDDNIIAKSMKKHLESWGFDVKCAEDFSAIIQEFSAYDPQLVLMDISLPFFNGYHWCQQIRKLSSVPIIFISSTSDNMNIVMAVNMGADDFIAKPFDLTVLSAKVQAILRRAYDYQGQNHLIEHNGAIFNNTECTVSYNGRKAELTKNENRIMQALLENKSKVVARDSLMTMLWECDSFVDENTLSVNITRLRKKLEGIGLEDFITTKKGLGYMVK
jgi:DNA-binding response OmpR family regulator